MIHLAVGRLEIDWGKNNGFNDHSALFQGEADIAQVPYYFAEDDPASEGGWKVQRVMQEGLSKPLRQVVQRLELLGYTEAYCVREFAYFADLNGFDAETFTFDMLRTALQNVDVASLSLDYGEGGEDFGKFFQREIAPRLNLQSVDRDAGMGMENLSAYTVLRLIADNPSACDLPVTWAFNEIEEGGWATRETFLKPVQGADRVLLVTEGSSDAAILRHALQLLRPHLADFFHFVDMDKGYPFTGTGQVYNFVKGLISIEIQNNVIVVFDNDAEGVFNQRRCSELSIPSNMRILRLPDVAGFSSVPTLGPEGEAVADINGKAAAIECYLDVPAPRVRWKNYVEQVAVYQGALEGKERYARDFLKQKSRESTYDYSKLEAILDVIFAAFSGLREQERLNDLETA
jgi:hypothetical protein